MKASRWLLVAAFSLGLIAVDSDARAADTYKIDGSHSSVIFKIKHFGASWFYGRFFKVEGNFTVGKKSSVSLRVDANSVATFSKKRDKHLRGADFFNVKQFPAITFESTSVDKAGKGAYKVTGKLTLHGVTKSVNFKMSYVGSGKDPWGGFRTGYFGTLNIKRSDYGMKYMLAGLSDEVELTLAIEGVKQK
jgi:polyisoprenoid-binding protein YceI